MLFLPSGKDTAGTLLTDLTLKFVRVEGRFRLLVVSGYEVASPAAKEGKDNSADAKMIIAPRIFIPTSSTSFGLDVL
ncbi:MAG: hypothetical protein PHY92_03855 [Alphaproteobacteria bacterium]|nr:hypothetical protein [Alphaproteobacteria bacterium]